MWTVLIIIFCIFMNAILSGMEIAFVSVNKALVKVKADKGNSRAKKLLHFKERPEKALSAIQIGITLLATLSSAVGGVAAGLKISPFFKMSFGIPELMSELLAIIFVVIPISFFSVVFGEISPKILAMRYPYFFSIQGIPLLSFFSRFLYPAVKLCEISTKGFLKLFPVKKGTKLSQKNKSKEYERVLTGYQKLPQKGKEYIVNLCRIEKKTVKDIMLALNEIDFININQNHKDVESKIISSGHTRLPVLKEGKILGIINTKEILASFRNTNTDWKKLIHPPIVFEENASLLSTLHTLQRNKSHMGIVQNINKKSIGIVIIEDILEEVFGQIYDEDD